MPVNSTAAAGHRPGLVKRPEPPLPSWGWIEWTILLQTVMPALLFIPAIAYSKARVALRVGAFAISLAAWVVVALSGRPAVGRRFPSQIWLAISAGWLVLEIFHPTTNAFASGVAGCLLNLAILAPAFWAATGDVTARRVKRVMILLILTNGAGALMGIAQFYRPDRFNPPVIPLLETNEQNRIDLTFEAADGRRVLRPCGLTDTPGGAGLAGSMVSLLGLAWVLNPMSRWKRLFGLSLAAAGVAAIMLSLARVTFVAQIMSFGVLFLILLVRRDYRRLSLMMTLGCIVLVAAVGWTVREGGEGVTKRYYSLVESGGPTDVYKQSRGGYLRQALEDLPVRWPLGGGLGRWGVVNNYFGNRNLPEDRGGPFWVEIQLGGWVIDGGIPLLVLYSIAILMALLSMLKIALRCRDPDLALWAGAVLALGISVVAACFVGCPFIGPTGMQFWILAAMVHVAGERAGFGPRAAVAAARPGARKAG